MHYEDMLNSNEKAAFSVALSIDGAAVTSEKETVTMGGMIDAKRVKCSLGRGASAVFRVEWPDYYSADMWASYSAECSVRIGHYNNNGGEIIPSIASYSLKGGTATKDFGSQWARLLSENGNTIEFEITAPTDGSFHEIAMLIMVNAPSMGNGTAYQVDVAIEGGASSQKTEKEAEKKSGEDSGTEMKEEIVETKAPKKKTQSGSGGQENPSDESGSGKPSAGTKPGNSGPGTDSGSNPSTGTKPGGSSADTKPGGSKPGQSGSFNGNPGGSPGKDTTARDAAILAIGGALAGAGAAGAAAGGGSSGPSGSSGENARQTEDDGKKKKRYKMYIYKNFGDAIQKGAEAVTVWARIAEISDGEERNRPDLSEKITASGQGLEVEQAGMHNSYRGARVSVPLDAKEEKGTLTFSFTGEGGTFRNNITFRLIGAPEVVFCSVTEDRRLVPDGGEQVILIAGAGGIGRKLFLLQDAPGEPKQLLVTAEGGFEAGWEKSDLDPFAYEAVIRNNSAPMDKEAGIFAEPKSVRVNIRVVFSNGNVIEDGFYFGIWPQGLTVLYSRGTVNELLTTHANIPSRLQNGRVEVLSYAAKEERDDKIYPTTMDMCYAVMKPDGTPRIAVDYRCFTVGKLQPTDKATENILEKYRYDIGTVTNEEACALMISPKDSLPEPDEQILVTLPVTASAEGQTEKGEIPLRLLGVVIDRPSREWLKEYDLLLRTALRHFPPPYGVMRKRNLEEIYNDPHRWDPSVLRMARYYLIKDAVAFWYREGAEAKSLEELYDVADTYFKKPFRFIGDTAFSIVVRYYYGDHENWISPAKDFFVDTVDEAFWEWIQEGDCKFRWQENLENQAVNTLENYITITDAKGAGIKTTDTKAVYKLAFFLVAYMTMNFLKDYFNTPEEKRDFWESLRKTFLNTSVMAVKKVIGAGFTKALNSASVQKFFKSMWMQKTTGYLHENLAKETALMKGKSVDYYGDMHFDAKVNRNMELINKQALDKLDGAKKLVHLGRNGPVLNANNLELPENTGNLLGGPGTSYQLLDLKLFNIATYEGIIQKYLDKLFGAGVAMLFESTDLDPESSTFGKIEFPIGIDYAAKKAWRVSINALDLFANVMREINCPAYDFLFDEMFGWFEVPVKEASDDIGKEVLHMEDPLV